jgi:hypothetical protein
MAAEGLRLVIKLLPSCKSLLFIYFISLILFIYLKVNDPDLLAVMTTSLHGGRDVPGYSRPNRVEADDNHE